MPPLKANWQKIVERKRAELDAAVPAAWKLQEADNPSPRILRDVSHHIRRSLSQNELLITETPGPSILFKLSTGQWTSVDVTSAFCHRAAIAHQLTNCLTEIFFESANRRAIELDEYFISHGASSGPLHGLPVSLKDRFHLRGLDSTCGYVSWINHHMTSEDEGTLIKELRELGAVFFVKTNVPMSMVV